MSKRFAGWLRKDGRVGVRDHLLVLPLSAALGPLAAEVSAELDGAVFVTHEYESAADDHELALAQRVFAGVAANPNVNACVAICDSSFDTSIADVLGRLPHVVVVDVAAEGSRRRTVDSAVRAGRAAHRPAPRQEFPIAGLVVGLECGGSDAWSGVTANPALGVASDMLVDAGATVVLAETPELIGAEHLLARRAVDRDVAALLLGIVHRYEDALATLGEDIRGAQPAVGNIEGGLTTIEEKSLGAAKKAGSRPIGAVVEFAERVPRGVGVVVMDTPGQDIEQLAGMLAGGCQVVAFTTGRGTPTGCELAPVLKIATNTPMFERLRDDLDVDAGTILAGESLEAAGARIYEAILAAAEGVATSSERRRVRHFAIPRFVPTQPLASYI